MPLSEHEQRILSQIEQRLNEQDPESARRLSTTTLPKYLLSNLRWSALGFGLGLAVVVASFASSWILAVFGFAIMLVSAVAFTHNMRRMGRHGLAQLRSAIADRNLSGSVEETRRRVRRRFGNGG